MANTINVAKLTTELAVTSYDLDPDATTLTDVAWVDMRDISELLIEFVRTVGTSVIVFNIIANTLSDGTGSEAIIKVVSPAAAPDAVGDYVFGTVLAEELAQKSSEDGVEYRYASANISFATATDEAVVNYIAKPRYKYSGLTSDNVA